MTAAALLACAALHAHAAPVSVSIPGIVFTPGSGYGIDASEGSGTRLGVLFGTTGFVPQDFELQAAGDARTFTVGAFEFVETNAKGGINDNETGDIDIVARIDLGQAFGSSVQLAGTGTATTGSVSDAAVDLTIAWDAVEIAFGAGGLLGIRLNDLSFSAPTTLTPMAQMATVTLLRAPAPATPLQVPEPATMLLVAVALVGLGCARRLRRS